MTNHHLHRAKTTPKDEYYTQLEDIEHYLTPLHAHFTHKTIYLNCDNLYHSMFARYFIAHFNHLHLKKLITTSTSTPQHHQPLKAQIHNVPTTLPHDPHALTRAHIKTLTQNLENATLTHLTNGSYDHPETQDAFNEADLIITNPPFSKLLHYMHKLLNNKKEFLILANINTLRNTQLFNALQHGIIHAMPTHPRMRFIVPNDYTRPSGSIRYTTTPDGNQVKTMRNGSACWITTINTQNPPLPLTHTYHGNEHAYPKYDHYDAININRLTHIPSDYPGLMGVPITYLARHNPDQFIIHGQDKDLPRQALQGNNLTINGKAKYARIIIQHRNPKTPDTIK